MKKTFGRLIMAALLLAVILSASVFVSAEEFSAETDGTYSIAYTTEMGAVDGTYYSMVVVKGIYDEADKPEISEETVLYIGQVTAGPTGATFAGWKPKAAIPATVYVGKQGGTEVELIGYINNNMAKVSGTVTSTIPGGTKYEATVTVTDASTSETVATATTVNGKYSVYLPFDNSYNCTVSMKNHEDKTDSIVVSNGAVEKDFALEPKSLLNGFEYDNGEYDYHGDGVTDYVDLMIAANVQANGDGADVTATYSYADGKIVGTASDAQGFAVRQVLSIDKTMFNIAEVKSAITLPAGAVERYYKETTNGNIVTVEVVYSNITSPSTNVITINAPLADGVAIEDFQYNTFKVESVAYANEAYNYYKVAGQTDNIKVVNNLTAHVGMVEIDVAAGETVYLQDGSVKTVTTTGKLEVPAAEGYVAVNVGYESQRTYYISGGEATRVHTNAVVTSNRKELRDRTKTSDGEDKNGLRFGMIHNPNGRKIAEHQIIEVGFVITIDSYRVNDKLEAIGMTRQYITVEAVELGAAAKGVAYSKADEINIAFDQGQDEAWDIRAVFYGIPITQYGVTTEITARPYYKVNETYIYGEATSATLAQVAKAIKGNAEAWDGCTDSMKNYINEILALAPETTVEEAEVIIDITNLFEQLGLTK